MKHFLKFRPQVVSKEIQWCSMYHLYRDESWCSLEYSYVSQLGLPSVEQWNSASSSKRDATAEFRLDTTFTYKKHKRIQLLVSQVLTKRTDYVNKYPSLLQTTKYKFLPTSSTPASCIGDVKPHVLHVKNPCLHWVYENSSSFWTVHLQDAMINSCVTGWSFPGKLLTQVSSYFACWVSLG